VFVCEKSPALPPVIPMLLMVKLALPVLLKVMLCPVLVLPTFCVVKVRLEGERLTWPERPVPVRPTECGLPGALSVIVTAAVSAPINEGASVTLIVQLPPPATELPQVLVWEKSPLFAPVTEMLVMAKLTLPVLVRVMDWEGLDTPKD